MSVDTHLKGKNLDPYKRLRDDDLQILVEPTLVSFADEVLIDARGLVRKRIVIDINHHHTEHCNH